MGLGSVPASINVYCADIQAKILQQISSGMKKHFLNLWLMLLKHIIVLKTQLDITLLIILSLIHAAENEEFVLLLTQ